MCQGGVETLIVLLEIDSFVDIKTRLFITITVSLDKFVAKILVHTGMVSALMQNRKRKGDRNTNDNYRRS